MDSMATLSVLDPSDMAKAKAPVERKEQETRRILPEEVKPILFVESTDEPPSVLSNMSFRPGMTTNQFWKKVITDVEDNIRCQGSPRIPLVDYSVVLPPRLRDRVKKIMPYEYAESDDLIYIKDDVLEKTFKENLIVSSDHEEDDKQKHVELRNRDAEESFNESEYSDIERMENEFHHFDLKVDEPLGHAVKHVDYQNWMSRFVCGARQERIIWKTKAYEKENTMVEKTLDEQAEELMDMSAERFIEWLNSVGSGKISMMTAPKLKELFSIKGDRTLLASIRSDPKEVNAIAKTVAEKWNKPSMAIELQYENHINYRVKQTPKNKMLSSFGRTIPSRERPWSKLPTDVAIKTVYPKDLLTRERIFRGIRHLRSVKALVDFYLKHPKLPRPPYLVQSGAFNRGVQNTSRLDIPLYEKLGLKY